LAAKTYLFTGLISGKRTHSVLAETCLLELELLPAPDPANMLEFAGSVPASVLD